MPLVGTRLAENEQLQKMWANGKTAQQGATNHVEALQAPVLERPASIQALQPRRERERIGAILPATNPAVEPDLIQ